VQYSSESASAGTYVIRTCDVPGDINRPIGPWRPIGNGSIFGSDNCVGGGGFGLNSGAMPAGAQALVQAETPQTTNIRQVRLWLVARLAGTGSTMVLATSSGNATSATPAQGIFQSPGGDTLSAPYVSGQLAPGTQVFQVLLLCSFEAANCVPAATNILEVRGTELTLEEGSAPTASIDGGELLAPGSQTGIRALTYSAADQQSGVARVSALVGKTVVATADFAAECAYDNLAACPQTRSGSIAVDTRKVPDGLYPVSLLVTDAAGNQQTVQSPTAIQVSNGAAGAPNAPAGSTVPASARVIASFAANRRATLLVGYGRRAVIRGRLVGAGGDPIGGASLDAEQRPASGAGAVRSAPVTTGADGAFSLSLGRGPSRTVLLTYGGATKRLKLRVKASATLGVSLRGVLVRYHGRVLSTPLPNKGKIVEVQGRAPGAGWRTFAQRRTNASGEYSGTYRLKVRRPGVRLKFRVHVTTQTGYPFVSHVGKTVIRTVH
jgi:hypothetical protein